MSDDIRSLLIKLTALDEAKLTPPSVKHGLNPQQQKVPQLPALFKPKHISVLTAKKDPEHPMKGFAVGSALEEAMQEVEEDMLGKVKRGFADYLEQLEKKNKIDPALVDKAKAELNIDDDPKTEETDVDEVPAPAILSSPVKTYDMDDGGVIECWGDSNQGFELRRGGKTLNHKFKNINDADIAVKLYQKMRAKKAMQSQQSSAGLSQDYIEEK